MSLDDRLRRGFERATKSGPTPADAALANVIAAYHAHKRRRAALLVAAAVATTVVVMNGDRAVRWVEGLERRQPPAHQDRGETVVERDAKQSEDRVNAPDGGSGATTRRDTAASTSGSSDSTKADAGGRPGAHEQDRSGVTSGTDDRDGSSAVGPSDDAGSSEDGPELSRYKTKKWSRPLGGGDPPPVTFRTRGSEHYVLVRLDGTGGGGTSEVAGGLYEIVDGESRLLEEFCGESSLVEVEPRTEVEVRVSTDGCSGTDTWLKGTATVDFYR